MGQALEAVLPFFAPLPSSILLRLLAIYRSPRTARPLDAGETRRRRRKKEIGALECETGYKPQEWQRLEQDFLPIRREVYRELDPLVKSGQLTTSWLLEALTPPAEQMARNRVPRSTLSEWEDRGFIDLEQKHADPHKAAALRIARIIVNRIDPDRERQWLPKGRINLAVEEEILERHKQEHILLLGQQWHEKEQRQEREKATAIQQEIEATKLLSLQQTGLWRVCWRWDVPIEKGHNRGRLRASLVPPPLPLASETLLATGWMGELWEEHAEDETHQLDWKHINSKGLICFSRKEVTFEGLVRWIPESEAFSVPYGMAPDLVLKLSDLTLNKLGSDLFSQPLQIF